MSLKDLWKVKGEGNANLVYQYIGTEPQLKNLVFRVPKRDTERKKDTLEEQIWKPLINWDQDPLLRNASYIQNILSSLLGSQYVFAGTPYDLDDGTTGLLLPDHSLIDSAPAHCAVLGPTFCLELKPKCGFVPGHSTRSVAQSLTLTYPRFVLHMLLKHVENRQNFTRYTPVDIFSGDPARMRRAIVHLFQTPSNNLRLFLDGEIVYGGRPGAENKSTAYEGSGTHVGPDRLDEHLAGLGESCERTAELVTEILRKEGVLDRLLEVQRLDQYGIETTYYLYEQLRKLCRTAATAADLLPEDDDSASKDTNLKVLFPAKRQRIEIEEKAEVAVEGTDPDAFEDRRGEDNDNPHEATSGSADADLGKETSSTQEEWRGTRRQRAPRVLWQAKMEDTQLIETAGGEGEFSAAEALRVLRDYLTAATAKDCGIMVSFCRCEDLEEEKNGGVRYGGAQRQPETGGKDGRVVGGDVSTSNETIRGAIHDVEGDPNNYVRSKKQLVPNESDESNSQIGDTEAKGDVEVMPSKAPVGSDGFIFIATNLPASDLAKAEVVGRNIQELGSGGTGTGNGTVAVPGVQQPALRRIKMDGRHYLYKVAFCDLDMKAAAKIPSHFELEQRISLCAEENGWRLEGLVNESGGEVIQTASGMTIRETAAEP